MLWAISCVDKPNTAAIREGQWNPAAAEGALARGRGYAERAGILEKAGAR